MQISLEEIQTLSILDAVGDNQSASQRDLSRTTGLNLANVNFLLRRLAEKGQVKLRNVSKNPNKRRYLYILTPRGIAEKSRLTLRFAARTLREYSRTLDLVSQSLSRLVMIGVRQVVLLGANEVAELVIEAASDIPELEVVGIISPQRAGGKCRGIPISRSVNGVVFDRAIPCDDIDIHTTSLANQTGIPMDKIWLM
jgi:EPS-associated MarR family transcriptional regulator